MDVSVPKPDLEGKRKTLALSAIGLTALAAGGEGYRRRGQSDSSDWAKKGLVLIAVLAAVGAVTGVGVRRRRAQVAPDTADVDTTASIENAAGLDVASDADESADADAETEPKKRAKRAKRATDSASDS